MLKEINSSKIESFDSVKNQYPRCRFLMRVDSFSSRRGRLIAVSNSVDTDKDIAQIMQKKNSVGELCVICGDYVHEGENNVVGSII